MIYLFIIRLNQNFILHRFTLLPYLYYSSIKVKPDKGKTLLRKRKYVNHLVFYRHTLQLILCFF